MTKLRVIVLFSTIIIVGIVGYFVSLIARGYKFDINDFKFLANGILVAKSDPNGASIYINGDLLGATNTNLKLTPGSYDVEIKKNGHITWAKRLTIKKEEVTQITAQLFKTAASLSPITFTGAQNPVVSNDFTKIAYISDGGLWVMSVSPLPIGFPNEAKMILNHVPSNAQYRFSPNGRQILLTDNLGNYLIDANQNTPQNQLINITGTIATIEEEWEAENTKRSESELKNLPVDLRDLFERKIKDIKFSPDETMVMYTASSEAKIKEDLIPKLPGSSTQKEERDLKVNQTYIYDIKEDKNFHIGDFNSSFYWLPTSRHIIQAESDKIVIMDYDGTNRQTVFSGNYIAPHAYPFVNASKLLILTNLGSDSQTPNLYSLSIK